MREQSKILLGGKYIDRTAVYNKPMIYNTVTFNIAVFSNTGITCIVFARLYVSKLITSTSYNEKHQYVLSKHMCTPDI